MRLTIFLFALFLGLIACGQGKQGADNKAMNSQDKPDSLATPGVIEYLGVNGPFKIGDYTFHLRWSSHPAENYYKQEYVPSIYDLEKYIQMVMVEVAIGKMKPKDAMEDKIKEIESRKATDKLATYTASTDPKTGDPILEFTLSENYPGDGAIAEWNLYRYVPYTGPDGKKGLLLFAFSRRGYGVKADPFLGEVSRDSQKFKANFMVLPVPAIKIQD
jgi:hypothetical protein